MLLNILPTMHRTAPKTKTVQPKMSNWFIIMSSGVFFFTPRIKCSDLWCGSALILYCLFLLVLIFHTQSPQSPSWKQAMVLSSEKLFPWTGRLSAVKGGFRRRAVMAGAPECTPFPKGCRYFSLHKKDHEGSHWLRTFYVQKLHIPYLI